MSSCQDPHRALERTPPFLQETLRLLCFDCLVADSQNVMSKTLDKRYWVGGWFIAA